MRPFKTVTVIFSHSYFFYSFQKSLYILYLLLSSKNQPIPRPPTNLVLTFCYFLENEKMNEKIDAMTTNDVLNSQTVSFSLEELNLQCCKTKDSHILLECHTKPLNMFDKTPLLTNWKSNRVYIVPATFFHQPEWIFIRTLSHLLMSLFYQEKRLRILTLSLFTDLFDPLSTYLYNAE